MKAKAYDDVMLFMGVLSTRGFPENVKTALEDEFGPILSVSDPFPFDFTDYYVPEMGEGIERFFISFSTLMQPDALAEAKAFTNTLELSLSEDGKRMINLDPGLITEGNIILATTKNRAHRIAIGCSLYAEVTLMYHRGGFEAFPWTYADYRSERVQEILKDFRKDYLKMRKS